MYKAVGDDERMVRFWFTSGICTSEAGNRPSKTEDQRLNQRIELFPLVWEIFFIFFALNAFASVYQDFP